MSLDYIRVMTILPASAARVYSAWIDTDEHTRMTGAKAMVDPKVDGLHSAWDGYIAGRILELEPDAKIVQSWRTSQFPAGHAHSRLEVRLRDVPEGCEITIVHSEIPEGQGAKYESGWQGHYFNPMTEYFRAVPTMPSIKKAKPAKRAAAKRAPAKKTKVAKAKPAKRAATRKAPVKAKKPAKAKKSVKAKKPAKKSAAKPAKGARGKSSRARRAK
jgi:uncharacterized protein YndB with AHSA1/START domain